MSWHIEYYEQSDGRQPAEEYEDELSRRYPKLLGKTLDFLEQLERVGPQLGGGRLEKCHDYPGLWEIRAIFSDQLARTFRGFDGDAIILLHGYMKAVGKKPSPSDFKKAYRFWLDYQQQHKVSPEVIDNEVVDDDE